MPRIDGDGYAADLDHLADFDLGGPEENDLEDLPVPERVRPRIPRAPAARNTPKKDKPQ